MHLIDFDRVELTNLNRQQYGVSQLGMPKPEALKKEILEFAPYLDIRTDFVRLTEENIPSLLAEEKYICEAFDAAGSEGNADETVCWSVYPINIW